MSNYLLVIELIILYSSYGASLADIHTGTSGSQVSLYN